MHDTVELIAAAVLVVGGTWFTLRSLRPRSAPPEPPGASERRGAGGSAAAERPLSVRRCLALGMAGLSAGAGVIHLAAAPSHVAEIGELAIGFLVAAVFQGAWVRWCLAGPSARTALVGIAGNLAIVAAWVSTRTIGLPVGVLAGTPEPVGYPDGASVVFELLLVGGLVVRWFDLDLAASRRRAVRVLAPIAVVPVLGLVLVVTSVAALAAVGAPQDHEPAGHPGPSRVAAP